MGFIREIYTNGSAGLIVSFSQKETTENFFAGDSIEEAIKHFKLFIDSDNRLRIDSESERAMDELEIKASEVKDFREKVTELLVNLDNDTAVNNAILFPQWKSGVEYKVNERIRYNNVLYTILQEHTSQEDWRPDIVNSLYARVLRSWEEDMIPTWEQPESTNGFMIGDKVYHNGLLYISTADNNIWEPGIGNTPWELVVEEQPEGSESKVYNYAVGSLYAMGDHIIFNGVEYKSLIDNNSWSPADYPAGWAEVTE
jgi:hypothetical protein